jgi:hypothetical protein
MHGIDIDDGPSASSPPAPTVEEPNREELVAKRDAEIKDRIDSALQFKKEVSDTHGVVLHTLKSPFFPCQLDENQKKESDELEAAKAKHDANLTVYQDKASVGTLLTMLIISRFICCLCCIQYYPIELGV